MDMMTALIATAGTRRKLARPVKGLRATLGYYVEGGQVLLYDPTALAADLRSILRRRAEFPPWEAAVGEWEVIDGR